MFRVIVILLFLGIFFCPPLQAGEVDSLTLDEAVHLAYQYNPDMQKARKEIDASKGRKITASAIQGPEAKFELGGFKTQKVDGERITPKKKIDSIEIIQPFDVPGVRDLRSSIAGNDVKISKGELLLTWAQVYVEVKGVFLDALYLEEAIKAAQVNLETAREFLDRVTVNFQSGNALKSEWLRAKIEISKAEEELISIENQAKLQKAKLNLLLGQPSDKVFSIDGQLSYSSLEVSREKFLQQAYQSRQDLLNQRIRLESAGKSVLQSKLSLIPQPFVGFSSTKKESDNDYAIIFGAKLSFWDFNLGEIKEKRALEEKEKIQLSALEREISNEVDSVTMEVEFAKRQFEIKKREMEEANELLRESALQYAEGKLNFLTYLENIKTIKETRLSYLSFLKDYAVKLAELEKIVGGTPIPEGAN